VSLWARREGPEVVPRPYMKLLRGRANGLRSAMRSALPTVVDPGLSYESTHDDDHVREAIQKSMTSPRLSVHQLLMGVVSGVRTLHHPSLTSP
jgi:hypothetical protein